MRKTLILLAALVPLTAFAQADRQLTDATVRKAKIKSHIRFLASDELRGRDTPSPEQMIAARYIATQLQGFGVQPLPQYPDYLQPVAMKIQGRPEQVRLAYGNQSFQYPENSLLIDGTDTNTEAEAVFLGFGTEADFKKADLKGKIVFMRAGSATNADPRQWLALGGEKRRRATAQGAVALVELYNSPQLPWKVLAGYLGGERMALDNDKAATQATHIWLHDADAKEAAFWAAKKKAKVQVKVQGAAARRFTTYNIVGQTAGTDAKLKDEYVVYSAHYDHIGIGKPNAEGDTIYNGARDNAIGTVTVLSAAENLARHPTKRPALFVLFTGEEKGMLGSNWFVEHPPVPLKNMVYCFNSDNAGYNDTTVATIIGLGRTTAESHIKTACQAYGLSAIDDPVPTQNLFDRSDNVSFAKKGIPAPTFSLGLTAFDGEVTKHYHQASDQWDTLNYDYLYRFFSAYVYACRLIGNAPERPFWKSGDKYYNAATDLYR